MTPEEYIAKYKSSAQAVQDKYKIPMAFALAQSALESSWGAKTPGNNFFGIRVSKGWKGKSVAITTHEVVNGKSELQKGQAFRAYDSATDSFLDWGNFLTVNPRYAKAFTIKGSFGDVGYIKAFAAEVAKAGYSTNPQYFDFLSKVIDSILKRLPKA